MQIKYVEYPINSGIAVYLYLNGAETLILPINIRGTDEEKNVIERAENGEIEILACG